MTYQPFDRELKDQAFLDSLDFLQAVQEKTFDPTVDEQVKRFKPMIREALGERSIPPHLRDNSSINRSPNL